eukprot:6211000-Pleurochrysis_carterae.AAC.2
MPFAPRRETWAIIVTANHPLWQPHVNGRLLTRRQRSKGDSALPREREAFGAARARIEHEHATRRVPFQPWHVRVPTHDHVKARTPSSLRHQHPERIAPNRLVIAMKDGEAAARELQLCACRQPVLRTVGIVRISAHDRRRRNVL